MNYSPWLRWLLTATGLGPKRVRIVLGSDALDVQTLYFAVSVPLRSVTDVAASKASWLALAGVHTDLAGSWTVNGAPGPVIALVLDPPAIGTMVGLRVKVRRLELGLADPEQFRARLYEARRMLA